MKHASANHDLTSTKENEPNKGTKGGTHQKLPKLSIEPNARVTQNFDIIPSRSNGTQYTSQQRILDLEIYDESAIECHVNQLQPIPAMVAAATYPEKRERIKNRVLQNLKTTHHSNKETNS